MSGVHFQAIPQALSYRVVGVYLILGGKDTILLLLDQTVFLYSYTETGISR